MMAARSAAGQPAFLRSRHPRAAIVSDTHFLIAAREGAYHTTDGGATWEHIVNGLPARTSPPSASIPRTNACSSPAIRRA